MPTSSISVGEYSMIRAAPSAAGSTASARCWNRSSASAGWRRRCPDVLRGEPRNG